MNRYAVRPASAEDQAALVLLMREYIVDFYRYPAPPEERLQALIGTLLKREEGVQLVAESEGRLVGFATLYFTYSTLRASRVAIMNDLYVEEPHRGEGAASLLFDACRDYAHRHGYASMSWETAADNERAMRFYEKMGGSKGTWVTYSINPARE